MRNFEGYASEAEVDAGAEVFLGAPNHAPLLGDSRVPSGLVLLLHLLGLRFLTPLLPQAEAQRQAFRLSLSTFFFCYILARSLGFCISSNFDYLLIYQDSSINSFSPFPVSSI